MPARKQAISVRAAQPTVDNDNGAPSVTAANKHEARNNDDQAIESCRLRLREAMKPSLARSLRSWVFRLSFIMGAYVMDW
jgi:hypothetical protein